MRTSAVADLEVMHLIMGGPSLRNGAVECRDLTVSENDASRNQMDPAIDMRAALQYTERTMRIVLIALRVGALALAVALGSPVSTRTLGADAQQSGATEQKAANHRFVKVADGVYHAISTIG